MRRIALVFILAITGATLAVAQQKFTYVELVKRLTDLEHLATLPDPGEQTAQRSSYNRASQYDAATGKYVAWDMNRDGAGIIRTEGDKQVFAEMEGPGCIWRIWSARATNSHVRIYLDGATEPAVDLPFSGYFDGKNEPFTRPALVHTTARGLNNYTPIPYQRSCKIVADPGWGAYYQFVYTTFPKGTRVPTFKRQLSAAENAALDEANKILSNCGPSHSGSSTAGKSDTMTVESAEGTDPKLVVAAVCKGPRAITSLRVKLDPPLSLNDRDAARALTIEARWDGESSPSVWAPFGDFFGTAPGAHPYRSLPCGLTEDGWWYAHWYMPFAKGAEITIRNDGTQKRKARLEIETGPVKDTAKLARFHAKWHRDAFLPAEPERKIDWTMLTTEGRGRFAGVMLHVWNPRGGWWGEGDEKFFVDGEKFPSTIGTGSEDYFGYAWCDPGLFQNAFHNQPHNDGKNTGHISVNRWHIADQIPFQKSFEGCLEKYYLNTRPTLFASTVFWYLAPGGHDPYAPVPVAERTGYYSQPLANTVPGVIEGESLKILARTGGTTQEQNLSRIGTPWSNGTQLWWTKARPGDTLDLAVPVAKTGKYKLILHLTKARDYGIMQLYLDGQKLGTPIDLYSAGLTTSGELDLGAQKFTSGEHKLTVEITGANERAVKSYMFGLDYVKLAEVQ